MTYDSALRREAGRPNSRPNTERDEEAAPEVGSPEAASFQAEGVGFAVQAPPGG